MSGSSTALFKTVLKALHYSGLAKAMAPVAQGRGVIFMLHQVGPVEDSAYSPNRILKVSPEFLENVIKLVKRAGWDIVSLDEVPARIKDTHNKRRFACFTLDDGYLDNIEYAYPVFKRHNVPFTIYLPTAFADGQGELWWLELENAIQKAGRIRVEMDGKPRLFETRSEEQKSVAFHAVYWWLRSQPEHETRRVVRELANQSGYDAATLCSELVMTWDQARELAKDPLVTFGGHTCHHVALAKLPANEARTEIAESISRLERELGRPCRHFSYPYGDKASAGEREFEYVSSLGLETAVTTRKGHVQAYHGDHMAALPRVSLNGDYQDLRCVSALLSGVPFMLWNGLDSVRSFFKRLRPSLGRGAYEEKLTT